jgi:hypothetical protein
MTKLKDNPVNRYPNDFVAYCGDMVVPIGGKFGRFRDRWDDQQRTLIEKLAPAAHAVIRGDIPEIKRYYVNATKGYGKDMIATLLLMFVLMFADRPTRAQLVANKQAQANEPLDIMRNILWADGPLNRLAAEVIEMQNYRVVSHRNTARPESVVEVLASDSRGHGSRPDLVCCNELSHLEDENVFRTADDNLAKCPHGLGLYLSNAGFLGTWFHAWHEQVLTDPLYDCTIINTPAPWIDPQVLATKARTDIPSRHLMYYYGTFVSPSGDVLPREQIKRATCLPSRQFSNKHPYTYIAAGDLSSTVNRSAICVFGAAPGLPIVLADARSYRPQEYMESSDFRDLLRDDIHRLHERFHFPVIAFDQHQSFLMLDLARRLGIEPFLYYAQSRDFDETRTNGTLKAEMLFRAFQEQWVHIYNDEQLILDLQATSIVTKPNGLALEFGRDSDGGHADMSASFSLGLLLSLVMRGAMQRNIELYGSSSGPPQEVLIA